MPRFNNQYLSHRKHHHPEDDPMSRDHSEAKKPKLQLYENKTSNHQEEAMNVDHEYYYSEQMMDRNGSHNRRTAFYGAHGERSGWSYSDQQNQCQPDSFNSSNDNWQSMEGHRGAMDGWSHAQNQSNSFHSSNWQSRGGGHKHGMKNWSHAQNQSNSFHSSNRQSRGGGHRPIGGMKNWPHAQNQSNSFHSSNWQSMGGHRGGMDGWSHAQNQSNSFHSSNWQSRGGGHTGGMRNWPHAQNQSNSIHSSNWQSMGGHRGGMDGWSHAQNQSQSDSFHSSNWQSWEGHRDRRDGSSHAHNHQSQSDSLCSFNWQTWSQGPQVGPSDHQSDPHMLQSSTMQSRSHSRPTTHCSPEQQNQPDMFQSLTRQTRNESDMFHHNNQCYASDNHNDSHDVDAGGLLNQGGSQNSDRNQQTVVDAVSCCPSIGAVTDNETFVRHSDASEQVGPARSRSTDSENKANFVCKTTNGCENSITEQYPDREETVVDLCTDENDENIATFDRQTVTTSVATPINPGLSAPNASHTQFDTCTFTSEKCLPVNSSQEKMSAIKAELDVLDVKFNEVIMDTKITQGKNRLLKDIRKKRSFLQKQLKNEAYRQSLENIQLTRQLRGKYEWKSEVQPSVLPVLQKESSEAQRLKIFKETCELTSEIQELNCEIEVLNSENMDEEEKQTLKTLRRKCNDLMGQRKSLCNRDKQLAAQQRAGISSVGIDPFHMLGRVKENWALWRKFKNSSEDSLCAENMTVTDAIETQDSNIETEKEADVSETSVFPQQTHSKLDSEETVDDNEIGIEQMEHNHSVVFNASETPGMMVDSCENVTGELSRKQRKSKRRQEKLAARKKIVDKVDSCVKKHDLQDCADSPVFLISALANLLLSKQQKNRNSQGLSEQNTTASDETTDVPASCNLVSDIANVFDLTPQKLSEQKRLGMKKHMASQEQKRQKLLNDLKEFDDLEKSYA